MIKKEKSHSTPHTEGDHIPDMTHIRNPDVLHEVSDVNTKPIYKFGFWMIVIVIGTGVLMWLFYDMLSAREARNDAPKPVVPNTASKLPPEPRLQLAPGHEVHPLNEMAEMQVQQRALLDAYGWADKSANTVRIPIAEAKRMLLAKGLPVGRMTTDTTGTMSMDSTRTMDATGGDQSWRYGRAVPSGHSGGRTNEWHR